MQSLCTLRNRCRQWLRNTRHQAGATPYLGRTSTGRIAPACGWRTHSITSSARASKVGGTVRPSTLAAWAFPKDVITDCDNGDRLRRLLGYFGREIAGCKNDVYFQTDQLGGELGKLLGASLSVAELDGDVLAVNETQRAQSLPKRLHPG